MTRKNVRSAVAAGGVLAAAFLAPIAIPASASAATAASSCNSSVNLQYEYIEGGTLVTSHCAYAASVSVDATWYPGGIGDPPCTAVSPSSVPDESNSVFFPNVKGAAYYC